MLKLTFGEGFFPALFLEKHVGISVGIKWRIEINDVRRLIRDVVPQHLQVVAEI